MTQPAPSSKARRFAPAGLIALSIVPVAAGAARIGQLADGGKVTPENARFFATPAPVVIHIIGASIFCLLGAFQFAPRFRRRRPAWHRITGRILVPCGLAAALSGLWMTLFYPRPAGDGELLTAFRLVFGVAMVICLTLAVPAIRRGDVARHRALMARGYAIGIGAGTQVLTNAPWMLLVGTPGQLSRALLMAAGWLINLAVAERIIRRARRGGVSGAPGRLLRAR